MLNRYFKVIQYMMWKNSIIIEIFYKQDVSLKSNE